MTTEDMLYGPVWETLYEKLKLTYVMTPIESLSLDWAQAKVREHAELYDAVVQQTQEIEQLNDFIEEVELDRDNARYDADEAEDRIYALEDKIQELEDELEAAREPKVD